MLKFREQFYRKKMKLLAIFLVFLSTTVQFVSARAVRGLRVPQLFEEAPLVVTVEVKGIEPLGIDTTLSYPTLRGVTFHWLRVSCVIETVFKGELLDKAPLDIAMLAVKKSDEGGLLDAPLMLSPKKGQKYLMFLAPTSKPSVCASIFAPYDESNAIFILDRQSKEYDFSHVVDKDYMQDCLEKKNLVWSLITEDGEFSKTGPVKVAEQYQSQIKRKGRDWSVALEWEVKTNNNGWSFDVPKDGSQTNSLPSGPIFFVPKGQTSKPH